MKFTLKLGGPDDAFGLNSFDEGVELAFQNLNSSGEWIPLVFYSTKTKPRNESIYVGDLFFNQSSVKIRGYDVNYTIVDNNESVEVDRVICGEEIERSDGLLDWVRFRWLQTVEQAKAPNMDRVLLDNILISSYSSRRYTLLYGTFENPSIK